MARGAVGIDALRKLQTRGIEIAIDDFGTGYSSLSYLKRLPVDKLKVDRAFVSDLAAGGHDAAIVAAIVALGRALHLTVIAEGVETPEQAERLVALGCDQVQGFYYGRPMAPEAIAALARGQAAAAGIE
jgi:EAL domain-containing protein (putative c-di-GMP-specific phosphodiesterase class I)